MGHHENIDCVSRLEAHHKEFTRKLGLLIDLLSSQHVNGGHVRDLVGAGQV